MERARYNTIRYGTVRYDAYDASSTVAGATTISITIVHLQHTHQRRSSSYLLYCIVERAVNTRASSQTLLIERARTQQSNRASTIGATIDQSMHYRSSRIIVNDQALGARSAVSADFDGDGVQDLASASSYDNAVSWYRHLGGHPPTCSIKNEMTWSSVGRRMVTVGDVGQ